MLRQYPMGRLIAFAYFLGVHLFIYVLLHRWGSDQTTSPAAALRMLRYACCRLPGTGAASLPAAR